MCQISAQQSQEVVTTVIPSSRCAGCLGFSGGQVSWDTPCGSSWVSCPLLSALTKCRGAHGPLSSPLLQGGGSGDERQALSAGEMSYGCWVPSPSF